MPFEEASMNRRPLLLPASLLVAAAIAACSGSPATQAPGTTPAAPGVTQAPGATSNPGVATPAGPPATPGALVSDPELIARMPTSMGGDPCKNQAYTYLSYVSNSPGLADLFQPLVAASGVSGNEFSIGDGSCTAVIGDESFSVRYDSLRIRGGNMGAVAQALPALQAQVNNDLPPTVTPATMGGRNGALVADADGSSKNFLWVVGDALFQYSIEDNPAVDNLVVSSFPG
jgi:hypothetical protein